MIRVDGVDKKNPTGRKPVDLSNDRFGYLYVYPQYKIVDRRAVWLCKCLFPVKGSIGGFCGKLVWKASHHLLAGRTASCGCHRAAIRKLNQIDKGI